MIHPPIIDNPFNRSSGSIEKRSCIMPCYKYCNLKYSTFSTLHIQSRGCASSSSLATKKQIHVVESCKNDINAVEDIIVKGKNSVERVAFDCEGVNLSRIGSIEFISITITPKETFLVDVGKNCDIEIVNAIKNLFENSMVTKIIHDCRVDSDALFHIHDIKLNNVHDTSCFDKVITNGEHRGLNRVLQFNGICTNMAKDNSIYKTNPAFWATRPITKKMIDWASSDVDKLFDLASKQLEGISNVTYAKAIDQSNRYASLLCNMKVVTDFKLKRSKHLFAGWYGAKQRHKLEEQTGTLIYGMDKCSWFVYYSTKKSLDFVKRVFANTEKKSNKKKIHKTSKANETTNSGSNSNTTNSNSKQNGSKEKAVGAKKKKRNSSMNKRNRTTN